MIFNGIDFSPFMKILEIKRSLIPGVLTYSTKIQGKDGARQTGPSELKEAFIEVKLELKNNGEETAENFFRSIAGKLYTKEEKPLTFKNEPEKHYMAKLEGNSNFQKVGEYGIVKLTFIASTPLAYGLEKTKPVNATFINQGTYESFGKITLTAPTGASLTIGNGTKQLELKYSFTGTQTIVVDLEKQFITMNGASAMKYLTLESDFFTIPSGSVLINTNGEGTVTFTERWL